MKYVDISAPILWKVLATLDCIRCMLCHSSLRLIPRNIAIKNGLLCVLFVQEMQLSAGTNRLSFKELTLTIKDGHLEGHNNLLHSLFTWSFHFISLAMDVICKGFKTPNITELDAAGEVMKSW
jgi:hypothetical protein